MYLIVYVGIREREGVETYFCRRRSVSCLSTPVLAKWGVDKEKTRVYYVCMCMQTPDTRERRTIEVI